MVQIFVVTDSKKGRTGERNCALGESSYQVMCRQLFGLVYTVVRPGGHPSNRSILPNSRLTGQLFWVIRLTGQLETWKIGNENCPSARIRVQNAPTSPKNDKKNKYWKNFFVPFNFNFFKLSR